MAVNEQVVLLCIISIALIKVKHFCTFFLDIFDLGKSVDAFYIL
jgi:hypothetical protein